MYFLLFFCFFYLVLSLKCLFCMSKKLWDDCKGKSIFCKVLVIDVCFKIYLKFGLMELFERGCSINVGCYMEINFFCKDVNECDIYCCNSNDCNVGIVGIVIYISGVLLLLCVLVFFVIFFKV